MFGYPDTCEKCDNCQLCVRPYYRQGTGKKLMLIGQDPTIFRKPERVKYVLMLNEKNGQLSRWLSDLIGEKIFDSLTVYATNLVKCSFKQPPSQFQAGGFAFLKPYFERCKEYLIREIVSYSPDVVMTFGEPTHRLFVSILDDNKFGKTMSEDFTGHFVNVRLRNTSFLYSPCLHIKTFRVAEKYGNKVTLFKRRMKDYL